MLAIETGAPEQWHDCVRKIDGIEWYPYNDEDPRHFTHGIRTHGDYEEFRVLDPSRMPARPAAGKTREHGAQPDFDPALLVAGRRLDCRHCRYFCEGAMAATASISTIYSGAASLLTSTSVLAGGAAALMYCARTARTSSALDMSVR